MDDYSDDDDYNEELLTQGNGQYTIPHIPTNGPHYWTIDPQELDRFTINTSTGKLDLPHAPKPTLTNPRTDISAAIGPSRFLGMAVNPDTGELCEYRQLAASSMGARWQLAFCIEWGRLFQGFKAEDPKYSAVQGTNTCQLIHPKEIPDGKKATYIRICSNYREQKEDPYRVRCTVGGNLINFPGDKSTRTADLVTAKCLINNVISTPGARAACIDIKDFYLNNDLPGAEYVRFRQEDIPAAIWLQYNLAHYVTPDGYIYARVNNGSSSSRSAFAAVFPTLPIAAHGCRFLLLCELTHSHRTGTSLALVNCIAGLQVSYG